MMGKKTLMAAFSLIVVAAMGAYTPYPPPPGPTNAPPIQVPPELVTPFPTLPAPTVTGPAPTPTALGLPESPVPSP